MIDIFTKRLNQTLQKQNITQKQLSELTGITEQSISRYVNGSRTPGTPELIKIADARIRILPVVYIIMLQN